MAKNGKIRQKTDAQIVIGDSKTKLGGSYNEANPIEQGTGTAVCSRCL